MKKLLAILMAMMMIVVMLPVGVSAAELAVTNDTELAAKLASADPGDTIVLAAGTYNAFEVTKSLTIKGAAGAEVNINITNITNGGVKFHAPNVTFENLNFVIASGATGAGWNIAALGYYYEDVGYDRDNLSVINCDFINNSTHAPMAIFASDTKSYTVTGCTFTNFGTGMATFRDGSQLGTVTITDNEFTNVNNPVNLYWGAQAAAGEGILTITGNEAYGALTDGAEPKLIITDHSVALNSANKGTINQLNLDVTGATVITEDFTPATTVTASADTDVVKSYKTEAAAEEFAQVGEVVYINYTDSTSQPLVKTESGEFEEYVAPTGFNFSIMMFMLGFGEATVVDQNGEAVVGVEFDLYTARGTKRGTYTTDENGQFTTRALMSSTYYLVPAGETPTVDNAVSFKVKGLYDVTEIALVVEVEVVEAEEVVEAPAE